MIGGHSGTSAAAIGEQRILIKSWDPLVAPEITDECVLQVLGLAMARMSASRSQSLAYFVLERTARGHRALVTEAPSKLHS